MTTDDLIRRLAAQAGGRRPTPPGILLLLALPAALAALGLVVSAVFGVRPDLAGYALTGVGALKFVGGAALAVGGACLAAALARPVAPRAVCVMALVILAAVIAAGAALVAMAEVTAPLAAAARGALRCVWPIVPLALPPLAVGLAALRRGASVHPARAGAAAGLAAGAVAALAYALWCPADDLLLVALGYGAALLVAAGIGAALGRRVLAW